MQFDVTVSLGHVLTVISCGFVGVGGYYALKAQVEVLTGKVQTISERVTEISNDLKDEIKDIKTTISSMHRR